MSRARRYRLRVSGFASAGSSARIRASSSSNVVADRRWSVWAGITQALRDHQAVDSVGREIFHVAVEQARSAPFEHAVAIANDGANGRPRSVERRRADAGGGRTEIGLIRFERRASFQLIRIRKLRDRDRVLVGMAGPCAVHQAGRLVGLVALQHRERARVELGILAAGIERGHAADRKRAVLVRQLGQERAHALKEGDVEWDRVAIREQPARIR